MFIIFSTYRHSNCRLGMALMKHSASGCDHTSITIEREAEFAVIDPQRDRLIHSRCRFVNVKSQRDIWNIDERCFSLISRILFRRIKRDNALSFIYLTPLKTTFCHPSKFNRTLWCVWLQKIYSRIARVCKNDRGGQIMMKDVWTTFSKARLNCSLPGEFPFYYDEIQGAAYHPEEGIIYATFTTPMWVSFSGPINSKAH